MLYKSFNRFIKETFGEEVWKVSVDAGFTCPVRDGKKGWSGCIFCDNRSFTPKYASRYIPLEEQIKIGIEERKKKGAKKFFIYFQPYTNTYGNPERLKKIYETAISFPDVVGIFIGTRPDTIPNEVLEILKEINKKTFLVVELGLQSANNKTLQIIKRGHTAEDFAYAVEKLHQNKIKTLAHIILGLPGETKEDFIYTAKFISNLKPLAVKIHPLHIVKYSELEFWYEEGKYIPLTLEEYIDGVIAFLENLHPDIFIARITGEAPMEFLIAPTWCLEKFKVLQKLEEEMKKRKTFQGKNFTSQTLQITKN